MKEQNVYKSVHVRISNVRAYEIKKNKKLYYYKKIHFEKLRNLLFVENGLVE